MNELEHKLNRARRLLAERQLDAPLLQQVSSFAWATCGAASHVNTTASGGVGSRKEADLRQQGKVRMRDEMRRRVQLLQALG